jgi:hypothetical protein
VLAAPKGATSIVIYLKYWAPRYANRGPFLCRTPNQSATALERRLTGRFDLMAAGLVSTAQRVGGHVLGEGKAVGSVLPTALLSKAMIYPS